MRAGRPKAMRINALLAAVAGAAMASHQVQGKMKPDARPVAVYRDRILFKRDHSTRTEVANKTKRGVIRRQTRGRR